MQALRAIAGLLLLAALTGGCASALDRTPLPNAVAAEKADIPNIKGARFWADEAPKDIKKMQAEHQIVPKLGSTARLVGGRPEIEILALSGGGSDGAFGAGYLTGWTASGARPEFEHVTGVSAGAIIAPFAFLGPEYDARLREIWTEVNAEELVVPQIVSGLLGGEALTDTGPLRRLVAKYVDRDFLKAVAREFQRGRLLTIGTTNLDAKRPVVWNMGAIALHYDSPEAVQLFRDVIIASAAIPGLFPPVNIKVKVDGKLYDEMHVDGGVTRQIYVTPVNLPFRAFDVLYPKPPIRRIFLVHNGKMTPEFGAVTPSTFAIAGESISALMLYQHKGDNYRIYRMAKDAGADFNSTAIPPDFHHVSKSKFDQEYQRALFEEGIRLGKARQWRKKPIDVPDDPPGRVAKPTPPPPPASAPAPPAADSGAPEAPAVAPEPPAPPPPGQPLAMDRVSEIETGTAR